MAASCAGDFSVPLGATTAAHAIAGSVHVSCSRMTREVPTAAVSAIRCGTATIAGSQPMATAVASIKRRGTSGKRPSGKGTHDRAGLKFAPDEDSLRGGDLTGSL